MKRNIFHFFIVSSSLSLMVALALMGCGGCVRTYYAGSSTTSTFGSTTTTSSSASSDTEIEEDVQVAAADDTSPKPVELDARDWTFWRGPRYNGTSYETGLADDFDLRGGDKSNIVWKNDKLGGRSTPVTMGGRLYTIMRDKPGTAEEGEKVVCADMKTGDILWENRFNVWLSDVPDTRVGWSSVAADPSTGMVYALGVCGFFQCINGENGETVWSVPMHERFGLLSTYGGRTNFPVICDDVVIISAIVIGWGDNAKPAHRFIGFDKATGDVVWFNGTRPLPYDTSYSSPTVTVIDGQKQVIFGSGDGAIWGFQPRTGVPIWQYRFSRRGLNVAPLVVGESVYSGHSEENVQGTAMGGVVGINSLAGTGDITKAGEKWRVESLKIGKSSPIYIDGKLYCCSDGAKLHIFDAESGEELFKRHALRGTMMRASPLYADGKIYAFTTSTYQVLKPSEMKPTGVDIVSQGRLPGGEEVYASPIVSHGKLFLQTTNAMYCIEDTSKKHGMTDPPAEPKEAPLSEDEKPAHLQIIPADLLIKPSRIHQFAANIYNSRGQLIGEASDVTWELDGPGEIVGGGTFLAPQSDEAPEHGHVAITVKAKSGGLEGTAKIRVVPSLPWKFDFEGLRAPPVTWVGARYRHQIREVDGSNVMVKVTTIPKGTRSRSWMGHPELSDYTIQADIKGALTDNKLPDIGLIAQGYTLDLQGANQKLELRTWVPHDYRTKVVLDYPWKGDTWYTMKLQAANEDGKAVLRGKIWPRDEMEPADWTLEAVDTVPNKSGSPGLFGNAKDAELYIDNLSVVSNDSLVAEESSDAAETKDDAGADATETKSKSKDTETESKETESKDTDKDATDDSKDASKADESKD